jgi:histidyl-tRNA synthetase
MYQAPRGTQDILPEEQAYWSYVVEKIHSLCYLYGYAQIETPIFEDTALYVHGTGESTDIVEKEMYNFRDKGGDDLTLRPEFTPGIVRAYLEHGMRSLPQPVKLYSIGPAFRYDRPQAGRYRQFYQFNVEAIGEQDAAVDFELMSLAFRFYEAIGFSGLSFELNSTGCPKCRPGYHRALVAYYRRYIDEICEDCKRRLERNPLRLLDCKVERCQPIIDSAPRIRDYLCEECVVHFETLLSYLDAMKRPYHLNHRLVRGLDYYTKTVFEVWAAGIGAQNALCGGGRYDGLAEALGGPPTPAVGFAGGLERTILLMKEQELAVPSVPPPRIFIAHFGSDARRIAIELSEELRCAGLSTVLAFGDRSLKAQMRQADGSGAAFALILGEDEVRGGMVTVRLLAKSEQLTLKREAVVGWLKEQ